MKIDLFDRFLPDNWLTVWFWSVIILISGTFTAPPFSVCFLPTQITVITIQASPL